MDTDIRLDQKWTEAEAVEKIEAGMLCKGILLCDKIEELTKDREPVIKVKTDLEFKGFRSASETFEKQFTSKKIQEIFEKNIDKCTSHQSNSASLFSVNLANEQRSPSQLYACGIHYEMVPIMAIDLTTNTIELKPEVITALRQIEMSIKPLYRSTGHFKDFFEKFGSHTSYGVVELGGILMGKAYCQDFAEEEIEQKKSRTLELSKKALKNVFGEHENEDDITVTVKKVGGKSESTLKATWGNSLIESNFCRIINRNAKPKPIWELLIAKHTNDFEKPLLLANAMEEEWETYTQPEVQERYRESDNLRRKRDMWIEWAKDKDQQFVVLYLKELANLRQSQNVSGEDWLEQVLYSPAVQNILTWAADCRKETNELLEKQQLTTAILNILDPIHRVQLRYFPTFENIIDSIDDFENLLLTEPFEITQLADLPHFLSECLMKSDERISEIDKCKHIQKRLELTVKAWLEKNQDNLECILCKLVLHSNGFDTKSFRFEYFLTEQEMKHLIENLLDHFHLLESITEMSEKQAYLLHLSLESKHDRNAALRETFDAIPDISPKIWEIREESRLDEFELNLDKFHKDINHFWQGKSLSYDLISLTEFLKRQFVKIKTETMDHEKKVQDASPEQCKHESIENILDALNMKKFYPRKLTYEDVIMLTSDMKNEST